jgi:hypothetical protein
MTMMDTRRLAAAVVVAATLGVGAEAPAQPQQTTPSPPATAAPRQTGAALAIPELLARLSRDGYRDFGSVERKSDRLYKLDARDAQGRKIELDVDARTAEVLASEADEDEDD